MRTVALVSAKGAPGVTTFACALGAIWPNGRDVVVAECDPSGGDLAARFGLATDVGMTSLVVAVRHPGSTRDVSLDEHVRHLPGGLSVLVGPVGADAGTALDRELAKTTLDVLAPSDVVIDCGRFDPRAVGQQQLLRHADLVLLLILPDAGGIAHGRWAADRLLGPRDDSVHAGHQVRLVVVGDGPFRPIEVADSLGLDLFAVVPHDAAAASMLGGQPGAPRLLARSRLVSCAQRLAPMLVSNLEASDGLRDVS